MAKINAAWGIDIGQCGLKAVRCRTNPDDPDKLIADAFDYIEYPKILTQPDAEPAELIADAIKQFLSRNSVKGARVAISVSTQSALARFISLPPVETKKIPDIVKYEAKQQIPFDLDEVIWDYQRMSGGSEEEGFALETEVGLFAMKRDQVYKALQPLRDADVDVDIVQLTPLALYNFLCFDRLHDLPAAEDYDPDEPPPSTLALSVGTQTTDLVVTNGFRIWQRTLQIGGSDFTKALAKELNLTYAKAEHLKRNATQAEDPKAVYQAMRPVFKSLLNEVQKSMGYFSNLDRAAKIGQVLALGNSIKLPGLKRYLAQNLGQEVEELEQFQALAGPEVTLSPTFKENIGAFPVAYGLAIQALGRGKLSTNLVPREIVRDRIIRDKKPWAVAAAALLMFGLLASYGLHWTSWNQVRPDKYKDPTGQVTQVSRNVSDLADAYKAADAEYQRVNAIGRQMVETAERRVLWLQALKAVQAAVPREPAGDASPDLSKREEIYITELQAQHFDDLATWYNPYIKAKYEGLPADQGVFGGQVEPGFGGEFAGPGMGGPGMGGPGMGGPMASGPGFGEPTTPPADSAEPEEDKEPVIPPSGSGFVIQLRGYHLHNPLPEDERAGGGFGIAGRGFGPLRPNVRNQGAIAEPADPDAWKEKEISELSEGDFVRATLLKNLEEGFVEIASADGSRIERIDLKAFGFSHPVLYEEGTLATVDVPDPLFDPEEAARKAAELGEFGGPQRGFGGFAGPGGRRNEVAAGTIKVAKFPFTVQVVWQPKTATQRRLEQQKAQQEGSPGGENVTGDGLAQTQTSLQQGRN